MAASTVRTSFSGRLNFLARSSSCMLGAPGGLPIITPLELSKAVARWRFSAIKAAPLPTGGAPVGLSVELAAAELRDNGCALYTTVWATAGGALAGGLRMGIIGGALHTDWGATTGVAPADGIMYATGGTLAGRT